MELELKFAELACCEPVGDLVTTQEESMETAIPEYCPDIARIVDTVGQLRLREKHPAGQQLTMGGSVVLTVLYTSEESAGLRSLSMEVPFSCQVEDKRLADCDAVCVTGRLLLAEAKAVTARKLYLRVMPEFTVSGYARRRQRLCCGTEEDPALRVRRQEAELELLTAVEEREFSFAQEVTPDGPPPEDVLMERTAARVEECRRVGSRLVLKGQAEVCVLYRGENQELAAYRTALPFSQLLDGVELPEGAETEARIQWASSEIRVLRTENGPAFGITVTVCAALLVRRKQQVSYIEDLYSLHHAAQVRRQETPLPVAWQRDSPSQEAVQQLEFGQGRPFAYLTAAECSGVSTVQESGGPALRCTVRLRVLYLDESGTPVCAERSAEVTAPAAWEPQTVRAACGRQTLRGYLDKLIWGGSLRPRPTGFHLFPLVFLIAPGGSAASPPGGPPSARWRPGWPPRRCGTAGRCPTGSPLPPCGAGSGRAAAPPAGPAAPPPSPPPPAGAGTAVPRTAPAPTAGRCCR